MTTNQTFTNDASRQILVLAGHGTTGRRVVQRLRDRGHDPRVGSRSGEPPFDWNDPSTWAAALDGIGAVYLVYVPDLTFPGAVDAVQAFSGLAVASGVEHIVALSGRGEERARAAERVVAAAGAAWTIVRSSWFDQNFSEGHLLEAVRSGELALPAGAVAEPFVDADDIADVVVAALAEPGHDARCYEVTGPELLTFEDAASAIGGAAGREVRYVAVSPAEFAAGASAAGVPEDLAEGLAELFANVLDGRNATLGDGVQRALGRQPRRFDDFCARSARAGTWSAPISAGGS